MRLKVLYSFEEGREGEVPEYLLVERVFIGNLLCLFEITELLDNDEDFAIFVEEEVNFGGVR